MDAVGEPESSTIATALLAPGEAGRGIGYGGDVAGDVSGGLGRLQTLEFGWIKLALSWRDAQPSPGGGYDFSQLDAEVTQARASNFQVLVRVHETPGWAGHPSCQGGLAQPPAPELLSDFRSFLQTAAARYAGQVTGYEIWNEPNTDAEWGNCNPNPADFVALMRQAYLGIKAGDPEAIVVSGGLSNTGDGSVPGLCGGVSGPICGDLIFLQEMYQAGARAGTHWDAIGAHPYGGTCTPQSPAGFGPNADCANGVGLYFRRMDNMRNIINDFGVPRGESPNVPIWPTEMGWVTDFDRGCNIGSKESNKVSLAQQGDYLRGSFEHAADQMPYIGPMFLFLIDHKVGFSTDCDSQAVPPAEFRWFSVFYEGGTPTSAALKLQATPKQPTSIVVGAVSVAAQKGSTIQATVKIINLGGSGERWTGVAGKRAVGIVVRRFRHRIELAQWRNH